MGFTFEQGGGGGEQTHGENLRKRRAGEG
jgi:hypothetical protein